MQKLIFSVLLLAGLLLLFVFRCRIIEFAATRLLEAGGAQQVSIKIGQLESNRCVINAFSYRFPGQQSLQIRLHRLTATWRPGELFHGVIRDVEIESLLLDLPEKKQNTSPAAQSDPCQLVQRPWPQKIPVHHITIRHLLLQGKTAGPLDGRALSLSLRAAKDRVEGKLDVASASRPPIRIQVTLTRQKQFSLQVQNEHNPEEKILHTDLQLTGTGQLSGTLTLFLDHFCLLNDFFQQPLPTATGTLQGRFQLNPRKLGSVFSLALHSKKIQVQSWALQSLSLRLDGAFSAASGSICFMDTSHLALSDVDLSGLSLQKVHLPLAGELQCNDRTLQLTPADDENWLLEDVTATGASAEQLSIHGAVTVTRKNNTTSILFAPDFKIKVIGLRSRDLVIPRLVLSPEKQARAILQPAPMAWSLQSSTWALGLLQVNRKKMVMDLQPALLTVTRAEGTGRRWSLAADLRTEQLKITSSRKQIPLVDINIDLDADNSRAQGRLSCRPEEVPGTIEARFSHSMLTGKGSATLHTTAPLQFSSEHAAGSLVQGITLPATLNSGTLDFSGQAVWSAQASPSLQAVFSLTDGAGSVKNISFNGLQIRQKLALQPELRSLVPGTISIAALSAGIQVHDIRATTELRTSSHGNKPEILVDHFEAHLFDGLMEADKVLYDINRPDTRCTIAIRDFDLARIITVQQVKDLHVTGRIDGILPLHLSTEGVTVRDGKLHNRPPGGTIRYQPRKKSSLASMELTAFAFKAMEDFRYNLLTADVEFDPDGQLNIAIHLEGHSPKLDTTRPVHLNINTEQNLLSLLKSLRYSETLTDELDKKIQQHYNRSPSTKQ